MAELTLEDWIPMSPLKGPPLPRFLEIYWPWIRKELPPEELPPEEYPPEELPPAVADIRVENLTISPVEVNVEGKVIVSVTATNYGTVSGSRTVTLSVNGETSSQEVNLSPGQSQQISFELTPREAKTYGVSVNGLSGSFKAVSPPKVIEFGQVDILSINGIPFSEVGYGPIEVTCSVCGGSGAVQAVVGWTPTGYIYETRTCTNCGGTGRVSLGNYKWARLQKQIEQPNLVVTVRIKNKSIQLMSGDVTGFFGLAGYHHWGGPGLRGYGGARPDTPAGGNMYIKNPPFEDSITMSGLWVAGSWGPGVYSCEFKIGVVWYEVGEGSIVANFVVKDFIRCTGSGSIG